MTTAGAHQAKRQRAAALKAIDRSPLLKRLAVAAAKMQRQRDQALSKLRESYEMGAEDMRIRCLSVPRLTEEQRAAITAITAVPDNGEAESGG